MYLKNYLLKPNILADLKVIIIDDQFDTLSIYNLILEEIGVNVKAFVSAQEALKVLEEFKPDVIVCDIELPVMNGYSVVEKIKEIENNRNRNIPAIGITGLADSKEHLIGISDIFDEYLFKPFPLENLIETIIKVINPNKKFLEKATFN